MTSEVIFAMLASTSAVVSSFAAKAQRPANGLTDDLSVVDVRTMRVVNTIHVGTRPWGIVVVP